MIEKRYEYGEDFEKAVLHTCVVDPSFFRLHHDLIMPASFNNKRAAALVAALIVYWDRFQAPPSEKTFALFIEKDLQVEPELASYFRSCLESTINPVYVQGKIVEFARNRAVEDAILQSSSLVASGRYDEIREAMSKALSVGAAGKYEGYDYFKNTIARMKSYGSESAAGVVPTGIASLDAHLDNGGLGPGELGLVQAPPEHGKTAMLINIGAGALLQGLVVVHFTLEASLQKVARRYDMRLCGMTKDELISRKRTAAKLLIAKRKELNCALVIKQYPTKAATVRDITGFLNWLLEKESLRPHLLVVDYGDILAPEKPREDRWVEIGESYEALRGLAVEWNIPLWAGSQTKASALNVEISDMRHTGGTHEKNKITDVLITLNLDRQPRNEVLMKVLIAKNREEKSGDEVLCRFQRDTQTIIPD